MLRRCGYLALMTCALLVVSGCGGKRLAPGNESTLAAGGLEDLRIFPQDLRVYAKAAGADKLLLDAVTQAEQDQRFNRIYFGPWDMSKSTVRRRDLTPLMKRARGFKMGSVRWTQGEWDQMSRNAQLGSFPSLRQAAITVRQTDLRELPSHEARFSEPTPDQRANPFDYFQYSLLQPGTPLFISHTSRDGRWYFVECPLAGGWIDANDLAFVDDAFERAWRNGRYAALLRDKILLRDGQSGQEAGLANIGTVLPLAPGSEPGRDGLRVLVALKGPDGMARLGQALLAPAEAALKPLPITPGSLADVGNVMMGQRYGWGGMFGDRDCSALTRDLFTPFGIWLPRNSRAQYRSGLMQPLGGTTQNKESALLTRATPFLSLVWMPGHITLYLGKYKNRAAIFHNVWGLRIIDGSDDDGRFVIGRAVVTSITPGDELQNLNRSKTFVDRIQGISTLGVPR